MKYFNTLFFLLVVVSRIYNSKAAACNPHTGPSGARHCIKFTSYEGYQWATCHTDSYIKLKSNGRIKCSSSKYSFCYYQCMLEEYGLSSGAVFGKCLCSPSDNSASKRATSMYNVVFLALFTISFMFTAL